MAVHTSQKMLSCKELLLEKNSIELFTGRVLNLQDIAASNILAKSLRAQPNNAHTLKASQAFYSRHAKVLKGSALGNVLYAIKVTKNTSLKMGELVDVNGARKGNTLNFLKVNLLHNVLRKDLHMHSAIVFDNDGNAYIRTKGQGEGIVNLLESPDGINLILQRYADEGNREELSLDAAQAHFTHVEGQANDRKLEYDGLGNEAAPAEKQRVYKDYQALLKQKANAQSDYRPC